MPNTRLKKRYAALLLSTALAGAASGFVVPVLAMRGALLGISLAIGIIVINTVSQKELLSDRQPKWMTILLAATIVGCVGGVVINLFTGQADEIKQIPGSELATIILSLCYSLTMHIAYARRWQFKRKIGKPLITMAFMCLAGILCTFFRMSLIDSSFALIDGIVFSLFTGVPFAALWALAVILCDPAWSFERWHSVVGSDNPE